MQCQVCGSQRLKSEMTPVQSFLEEFCHLCQHFLAAFFLNLMSRASEFDNDCVGMSELDELRILVASNTALTPIRLEKQHWTLHLLKCLLYVEAFQRLIVEVNFSRFWRNARQISGFHLDAGLIVARRKRADHIDHFLIG